MLTPTDFQDLRPEQLKIWDQFCENPGTPKSRCELSKSAGDFVEIYEVPGVGCVAVGVDQYMGTSDPQVVAPEITAAQVAEYDESFM